MWIESIDLKNFRNYKTASVSFDPGINFLYGSNAQGKTNILEAIYICATSRSHKGSKDKDIIRFESDESHIRMVLNKRNISHQIDFHLKKDKAKGIAINGFPIKKASELLGFINVVFFSPEDLYIIKSGPSERRRFIDRELSQLNKIYIKNIADYNKILMNRNRLLKDIKNNKSLISTLDVWDEQLINYGIKIIKEREKFLEKMTAVVRPLHKTLTGNKEEINLIYDKNTDEEKFADKIKSSRERDIATEQTSYGPQRDDFSIMINGINARNFGSQGQQKSAAISLKMAEIQMIKLITHEKPVLLLDDVFSELDNLRQEYLISQIKDTQTILTGTGVDDMIKNNIKIDRLFEVEEGIINFKK